MRKKIFLIIGLIFIFMGQTHPLYGQADYPSKPINFLVGYPPGGLSDLTARAVVAAVEKILKQPIVVLNKPGASASLAMALLAKAKPDGYTIGMIPVTAAVIMPHVLKVEYDTLKDFQPIVNLFNYAAALVVKSESPWKNFKEFIEYARQNPGAVKYGTYGAYGTTTIVMEALSKDLGVRWDTVPFKSDADAIVGLLGGHITAAASAAMYMPQVRAGKFRILAIMSRQRLTEFPDVLTLKDIGFDYVAEGLVGIGAPAGLPEPILKKLEEAFSHAVKDTVYQELLQKLALQNDYMSSKDFAAYLATVYRQQGELIRKVGLERIK